VPKGVITALEVQKRDKERVNLFLDGEYAFSLSLVEAAKLKKGQVLSEAQMAALRDEDAVNKAVDSAARVLSYRPRSVHEIRQHLAKKSLPQAVILAAIDRLSAMGYLDDVAFARFWVEDRNRFKPRGPKALRFELRQKGISNAVIDEVLNDTLNVDDAAYRAAHEVARKLRRVTQREFRHKLAVALQRRGFSFDVIRDVVKRLIDEIEAENPEQFLPAEDVE
jgi:regulatory protein